MEEIRSKKRLIDFSVLKEEISLDNIVAMSESIAYIHTRFLIGYIGTRMQKMNTDLFVDIKHKNEINHVFSDSYDLVQECVLYLCEHYGHHLSDVVGYTKKGKEITIRTACTKKMMKLVNRKTSDYYRSVSYENLKPSKEPCVKIQEDTIQDYTNVDKIIENLNLTENMRIALNCRMSGLSYPEIGRVLCRAQSTVFEYFIKMRKRYLAIYD